MRRWSLVAGRIAATTRTSEKTRLLAGYLRDVEPDALRDAVTFFIGRAFPESDPRAAGLGWATIADAVARVAGIDRAALAAAYDRHSDLGLAVGDVLAAREPAEPAKPAEPGAAEPPDRPLEPSRAASTPGVGAAPGIPDVAAAFAAIEAASGPAAKSAAFEGLLLRCDPLTATYVVKILAGERRIGLRDGLLQAAIAQAFARPQEAVATAAMLSGDLGETAVLAREDRLGGARLHLFRPLQFMLASPAQDAAEIMARLGPVVWTEDKYDGIRVQLHRRGPEARLFSRDLHDVSGQFPEVVASAERLDWDGILDGELLAYRDGVVLPFLALQRRLGRKEPSAALQDEVPVAYVAFDALALGPRDGDVEPLLARPLAERRGRLEALGLPAAEPARFAFSRLVRVGSTDELEAVFTAARARRNEGLMVKDPMSAYSPGRRGFGWLKMKKALATLDCVVVGVEGGHGKRHGVLSDYTFAVRDDATGALVTIGKAYSGLTDAEIAELTAWFEEHTLARHGRYRAVEPAIVVEVAFDVIMRSSRHQSGFALRFPRIARLRPDKTAADCDTLGTVEVLWRELQHGAEHLVTQGALTRLPTEV
jgi:DNA ligase-1